jgi:hypothetical protein
MIIVIPIEPVKANVTSLKQDFVNFREKRRYGNTHAVNSTHEKDHEKRYISKLLQIYKE